MSQRLTDATADRWTRGTLAEQSAARLAEQLSTKPRWHPVDSQRALAHRLDVSGTTVSQAKRLLADHGMYYVV